MRQTLPLVLCVLLCFIAASPLARAANKKVVILAGALDAGHPRGTHEYARTAALLKQALDSSPSLGVTTEVHTEGWPRDPTTLDTADTIVVIASGSDRKETDHPLLVGDRLGVIEKQVARGCGLVTIHWATFFPNSHGEKILDWTGGYFDYQSGPAANGWYSAIQHWDADARPAAGDHAILRGVEPFKTREEFYYNIRFREDDARVKPILVTRPPNVDRDHAVAWAIDRGAGRGRGFGFTGGHYFSNWFIPSFRRMVLNAIVWTAGVEVPVGGVKDSVQPIRALIVTGDNHPAHDWKAVTAALKSTLEVDPRIIVDVIEKPEELATRPLKDYAVLVLNYCNWNQAGLADAAKQKLVEYVKGGGGLSVIHFANGAFHPSLPNTGASDWPEYRKLVRRVWDAKGGSGHDAYGAMRVEITPIKHPITQGLKPFDSVDELYFNQAGSEPIEPLATAKSKVTGKDEPMAWAYSYGEGDVFQTVLGHSTESVQKAGELIRRGTLWAAGVLPVSGATGGLPARVPVPDEARADKPPKRADPKGFSEADWVDDRFSKMDTGPFFSGTILTPGGTTPKGIVVKLDGGKAAMCFDTELLTWRAGWTGGFLKIDPARYGLIGAPRPEGKIVFQNPPQPGWAGPDGTFKDPRPTPHGPMPESWGLYKGLHLHGDRVTLAYTVGDAKVYESVFLHRQEDGNEVLVRDLKIEPHSRPLTVRAGVAFREGSVGTFQHGVFNQRVFSDAGVVCVEYKPSTEIAYLRVLIDPGAKDSSLTEHDRRNPMQIDEWLRPAGRHWGEPLVTHGQTGQSRDGFAFDTITMPYENPWNALMFASGHDFFSNGDAAVCTIHGDVWLVSGIDEDLDEVKWKRFATGLYQPLGLKIIKDKVYVLGRDQITILHDNNADGEADFYENFNNEGQVSGGGHEYVASLETDAVGNFYFTKGAGPIAHGGTVLKVPASGKGIEVFATGFRYPNGLGVGPDGTVTVADQQGEWVPSTRLDIVAPGSFHGYMPMHHREQAPTGYDGPLCWIPHGIDNSAGGQVWVPPGAKWGPLAGQLLHFSYGKCTMMLVLRDEVEGVQQGAMVPLPGRFLGGAMRGRFNSRDGHLYVTGSSGWQTAAVKDGCFQRVRYTGEDSCLPIAFQAHQDGLRITFSEPLDKLVAEDEGSYAVERWNYRWAATYGSKDWSVSNPDTEGHDEMKVESASLSQDGRTVFLRVADMRATMQMKVQYDLDTAEGDAARGAMYPTVHRLRRP